VGRRKDGDKEEKYPEVNQAITDSDTAEINPRLKHTSQVTGNDIEEGDEDYEDEKEQGNKI